ncbi:glycosyltransferase involved in cell wall biosynthesis [Dysgonomonas sp. PH5-45]|uniref:glycosyltransferase n=1 Tax=unclassified Dysgonomonas TaxID=2630389 RepID=UPI00247687B3|nr:MULTISPECIES: glycosyltransferase [unclassified Dysgonomonas]MDH6354461.1 glycosyltransferase involved in cell wall biosynthesis [Dysgonomonas sp. PH5-45]MDH6387360.1 glycosyltransferase involved in cell wall biosynthesis [Dysgonomonas sp. PH5-37]
MKRILFFNDCFYMGGTEVLLLDILNHLAEKQCEVTLLIPNPSERNKMLSEVSPKITIKYIYPKQPEGFKKKFYKNLSIFFPRIYAKKFGINEKDYDLIVAFKDTFYSIIFSRMNVRKLQWVHTQPFERDYGSHSLKEWIAMRLNEYHLYKMRKSFNRYDEIICVSDSCKNKYMDIYKKTVRKTDIKVLYNAMNLSGIAEKSELTVNDIPRFDGTLFIVVVRLSFEKTVDRTIKMTRKLLDEGYDFRVMILGDGPQYDNLKKLIAELNLEDKITMYGRVSNPYPYMRRADWLLCGSSIESFSLVLLEAISLGTPVIATDCGGPEDVIARGKYGMMIENSIDGVYTGMKTALDKPELKDYYNSLASENLTRFDYNKWIAEVDRLLGVENL